MRKNRTKLIALAALLVVSAMAIGASSRGANGCTRPVSLSSGYSEYWEVGARDGKPVSISFERNAAGSGGAAVLGLEFCSRESATSCSAYNIDSDGDGVGDTNLLNATTVELSGAKDIQGFLYLRVFASSNGIGGEEPEFTVCRGAS